MRNTTTFKFGIAWPTLLLFLVNTFSILIMLIFYPYINYLLYLPLMSIFFYINFTPFHESAHNLITSPSSKYKYLNKIVAYTSNAIYTSVAPVWKFVHKQHHLYANNKELDPDKFYNSINGIIIYGCFLDYIYLKYYIKYFTKRPFSEQLEFIITFAIYLSIIYLSFRYGYGIRYTLSFYLPQRISLLMASFILDYNSHHDCADFTKVKDKSKITNKISGIKKDNDYPLITSILTQNQNYHNIHHINPTIPFYDYKNIWEKIKIKELQNGTKLKTLF